MFQSIKIIPHSLINGSVSPLYQIARFNQLALLKNIIRKKDSLRIQKTHGILQPVNILPFCRIHKNQVKTRFQLPEDLSCVSLQKSDLMAPSCFRKIFSGNGNPFFIVLNCCYLKLLRSIFTHKKCGEAYGCPHLQNTLRLFYSQKHLYKALHLSPDNGNSG